MVATWPRAAMARAALSVAGPLAVGMVTDQLRPATVVSLGALLAVFEDRYRWVGHRARRMPLPPLAGAAGILAGAALLDRGWVTALGLAVVAFVSGVWSARGGLASPAGLQFLLLAVVASALPLPGGGAIGAAGLFLLGAFVHIGLTLAAPHAYRNRELLPEPLGTDPWRYGGWLAVAIGVAEVLAHVVDLPRSYWVAVTIALVVKPDFGPILQRAAHRAGGTVVGVALGGGILAVDPPDAVLVAIVGMLAALVALGIRTTFLLVTAAVTPIVLIKADLLTDEDFSLVGARLLDSLVGCAIALAVGLAFEWESISWGRRPGRSASLRRPVRQPGHS